MAIRSVLSIFIACTLMSFSQPVATAAVSINEPVLYQTDIVIDAGHGGIDGGAVYGSLLEKDLNLTIARQLYNVLRKKSIQAVLNRKGDYALSDDNRWLRISSRHKRDLAQRTHLANALHPRLLVSIHMNTSSSPQQSGPLVIFQKKDAQSRLAAELIQQSLNGVYGTAEKPTGGGKYYLLNHAECPAVIVELGFLTNDADRQRLTNPNQQLRLARVLGEAIEQYLLIVPRTESAPSDKR